MNNRRVLAIYIGSVIGAVLISSLIVWIGGPNNPTPSDVAFIIGVLWIISGLVIGELPQIKRAVEHYNFVWGIIGIPAPITLLIIVFILVTKKIWAFLHQKS